MKVRRISLSRGLSEPSNWVRRVVRDRLLERLVAGKTGDEGGQAILEQLDQQNLFLIPLDGRRCWYRYHHLFRDVLRARLAPDRAAELQLRAARLIGTGAALERFFHGEFPTVLNYLAQLPQAVVAERPWPKR